MICDLKCWLSQNWEGLIAVVALIIALFDLFLHWKEQWRERANIEISQDIDESFFLSFRFQGEYHCAFTKLCIENKSKSDITVSSFKMAKDKDTYEASVYDGFDTHNKNGISLYPVGDDSQYYVYNIKTENLLNNSRIEAYGSISGYLFFQFPEQIFKETETVKLILKTPRKTFYKNIVLSKLPETLKPRYPIEG